MSIDNFNVNEDSLALEFNREILKDPFRRGWSSIIISHSNGGWYKLGEPSFCHMVLEMMHVDAPSSMM
jgi:hypothetical protein